MKTLRRGFKFLPALSLALFAFTGCESTDSRGSVSGSVYYGAGFSDPWYYGDNYYNDVDIIVTPPDKPGGSTPPPRPTHPIAPTPAPRPMPMPSIPRTPMPMPRGR